MKKIGRIYINLSDPDTSSAFAVTRLKAGKRSGFWLTGAPVSEAMSKVALSRWEITVLTRYSPTMRNSPAIRSRINPDTGELMVNWDDMLAMSWIMYPELMNVLDEPPF